MKEMLKKQNGIGAIAIILIIVLVVAVGCVAFLGIKSAVTGEPFLQPLEDMGLMEIEDDEDDADEDDKKEDKDVEVDEKEEDKEEDKEEENVSNDTDVIHYHGEMDFDDYTAGSSLEYSDLIEITVDIYATETEIEEMVMMFNLKDFLIEYYGAYEEEMKLSGFETYESFRDEMMSTFETSFSSGFTSSSGSDVEEYFKIEYPEEEIIEMHITEGGITQMYTNYGIEEGDSVKEIIEGFETALGVELKEV